MQLIVGKQKGEFLGANNCIYIAPDENVSQQQIAALAFKNEAVVSFGIGYACIIMRGIIFDAVLVPLCWPICPFK